MGRSEFQLLELLLHFCSVLILWSMTAYSSIPAVAASSVSSLAKPGCQSQCGHVAVPYPFGIGEARCYLTPGNDSVARYHIHYDAFKVVCNHSTSPPKPFLNLNGTFLELLEISIDEGTIKVNGPITFSNCTNKPNNRKLPRLSSTPFQYSYKKNRFTSISCGGLALLTYRYTNGSTTTLGGCLSICDGNSSYNSFVRNNSCGGINCCQITIPFRVGSIEASFQAVETTFGNKSACKYAFVADQDWFTNSTNISLIGDLEFVPVVLVLSSMSLYTEKDIYGTENWTDRHNSSYVEQDDDGIYGLRFCSKGFQGNPYLLHGCKDINECEKNPQICGSRLVCINEPGKYRCQIPHPVEVVEPPYHPVKLGVIVISTVLGVLFILLCGWWSHKVVKKRRSTKQKHKFYKQNGGLLLEQQLSSGEVNVDKIKLFNSKELDKATDHYSVDRILGQGGQGTVYKGMLADGRIVAVKKSKISDGGDQEVRQFINEIVILSQIIHRNVVTLLGCCLETEVPLLVYEFVANGTLFEYIHQQSEDFPLTWETRLRVAIEVAGALSYLHSAAALPIYHRDIKSSNILLDEKYRAKVADFGTSRSVSIDQTHVTTLVHGTFGYLDPEYFRSSQFTDKSDVYSFGVVLTELLTGQKPVSLTRSQEGRSLANYFLLSMEQNRLFEILDPRLKDCRKEEIIAVANIAKRCLHLNGRKRPTMKEVAGELEGIQFSGKPSSDHADENLAEVANAQTQEAAAAWDVITTSTGAPCSDGASSSFDAQPLLTSKTL